MVDVINSFRGGYGLGEELRNAPQRNALLNLGVQAQQQGVQRNNQLMQQSATQFDQSNTQFDQAQAVKRAQVAYGTLDALSKIPVEQRKQSLIQALPELQKFGFDPQQVEQMSFDDQSLNSYKAMTQGLLNDPSQIERMMPSEAREYEYFKSLTPDQKSEYLTRKRAGKVVKFNDVPSQVDELTGTAAPIQTQGLTGSQPQIQEQLSAQETRKQIGIAREKAIVEAEVDKIIKQQGQLGKVEDAMGIYESLKASDLSKIYGKGESIYPDLLRSQDGINMLAQRDQLVGMLELASAGDLKGQGSVSDSERKTLKDAATLLRNPDISPELAEEHLEKAINVIRRNAGLGKIERFKSMSDEELLEFK